MSGSLSVDSTMSTTGNLVVSGTSNFDSTIVVNDTIKAQDIVVTGNAKVAGDVNLNGRVTFGIKGDGFTFTTSNSTIPNILSFGKGGGSPLPLSSCISGFLTGNPNLNAFQLKDIFQIGTSDPLGTGYLLNGSVLTLQSWSSGSSIDVSGGTGGNGGLLVNYFCGKDIYLGTGTGGTGGGTAGSSVYTGDKFYSRKNVQIGASWQTIDPNVALNIFDITSQGIQLWPSNPSNKLISDNFNQFTLWANGNAHLGKNVQIGFTANTAIQDASTNLNINSTGNDAIKISTWNNVAKVLNINNSNFSSYSPLVIYGDGNAQMGQAIQIGMTNSTMKNIGVNVNISAANTNSAIVVNNGNKDVFRVLKNGETYIGEKKVLSTNTHANAILQVGGKITCQELVVLDPVKWADFVFEKNYKLMPLEEVEKFYKTNKHLKDVPGEKEVKENGISSANMDAILLQKIEELTLYTVELNKQVQLLKKESELLKKSINK